MTINVCSGTHAMTHHPNKIVILQLLIDVLVVSEHTDPVAPWLEFLFRKDPSSSLPEAVPVHDRVLEGELPARSILLSM